MPGVFGAVGVATEKIDRLRGWWESVWPDCRVRVRDGCMVGGHAHAPHRAVSESGDVWIAVDGEWSAYRDVPVRFETIDHGCWEGLAPPSAASVARVETARRRVTLAADWSGSFPLYWRRVDEGFVFSSHLDPLRIVGPVTPDRVGIVSFLKDAHFVGARTFYREVTSVQPGQVVVLDVHEDRVEVRERSRAWTGPDIRGTDLASEAWNRLRAAIARGAPERRPWGLMLSGGWDSRTLLGAALHHGDSRSVIGLSHGDVEGRELQIVQRLCEMLGVSCVLRPLEVDSLLPDYLEDTYRRCGTAMFPYWRRSAKVLAARSSTGVGAGVFGEVLGGHYGPAMARTGWSKIRDVANSLLAGSSDVTDDGEPTFVDVTDVASTLVEGAATVERYLDPGFWSAGGDPVEELRGAIQGELRRLRGRGVPATGRLIEAYLTEHRGAQYIAGQLRTARSETDVFIPFARRDVLELVCNVPLPVKIHNRLNQRMLADHRPDLLELSLAATLTSAKAPLIVQESSRAVRKLWEEGRWIVHHATRGRIAPPRLGWLNLEFLRGTRALDPLAEAFSWTGWNRDAVRELFDAVRRGTWSGSLHEPVHQLLKMYTMDLALRPHLR